MTVDHKLVGGVDAGKREHLAAFLAAARQTLPSVDHRVLRVERIVHLATQTTIALREALEDDASPVTWSKPSGTIKRPLVLDWDRWHRGEYCWPLPVSGSEKAASPEVLPEVYDWTLLGELTDDVAVVMAAGKPTGLLLPKAMADAIPTSEQNLADFVEEFTEPRCVGYSDLRKLFLPPGGGQGVFSEVLDDITWIALSRNQDGFGLTVYWEVGPLVIDETAREAYWPLTATASLSAKGPDEVNDPVVAVETPPSGEVMAELWDALLDDLQQTRNSFLRLLAPHQPSTATGTASVSIGGATCTGDATSTPPRSFNLEAETGNVTVVAGNASIRFEATGKLSGWQPPGPMTPANRTAPPVRYLFDATALVDRNAGFFAQCLRFISEIQKRSKLKHWDKLVAEESERLLELGEAAFDEGLLKRTYGYDGSEAVHLTGKGEDELKDRNAGIPYLQTGEDGQPYIVKRLKYGSGYIEARASLILEGPLSANPGEYEAKQVALLRDLQQRRLGFDEQYSQAVSRELQFRRLSADAGTIMDKLLRQFGHFGENPVQIPVWELADLIRGDWTKVKECLDLLKTMNVKVVIAPKNQRTELSGGFISEYSITYMGPGKHHDGQLLIWLTNSAIGTLQVFATASSKLQSQKYDLLKQLSKDERKDLDYSKARLVTPHFDQAAGLTPHQARIRSWIEEQLTLNTDAPAYRVDKRPDTQNKYRIYNSEFCPLLPAGQEYHAALGHFTKNPEHGWRLVGRATPTSATHAKDGWMDVFGYPFPGGRSAPTRQKNVNQCLADMERVLELWGGKLVGKTRDGQWIGTRTEWSRFLVDDLPRAVLWFPFVGKDWVERLHAAIESDSEARFAAGKTPYIAKVTTNQSEYEAAKEDRRLGLPVVAVQAKDQDEDDQEPIYTVFRKRLAMARKERKVTQSDLATMFGVSQPAVVKWESGKAQPARHLIPLLDRWIQDGTAPTNDELDRGI